MRAGELKDKIIIESPVEAREATFGENEQADNWSLYATVWAQYIGNATGTGGRELWRAQQVAPLLTNIWKIRYLRGVTTKMRVRFDDRRSGAMRKFGIVSAQDPDGRGVEMLLNCIEEL